MSLVWSLCSLMPYIFKNVMTFLFLASREHVNINHQKLNSFLKKQKPLVWKVIFDMHVSVFQLMNAQNGIYKRCGC